MLITALSPFAEGESKSKECRNEEMSPLAPLTPAKVPTLGKVPTAPPAPVAAWAGWAFRGGQDSTAPPDPKTGPPPCQRFKNKKQEFV